MPFTQSAKFIFLLFLLTLISTAANAATYYVATSVDGGCNLNNCSQGSPCETLLYASNQVVAGDTVYIKQGTYGDDPCSWTMADGTSGNPIRFIGYTNTPDDIISDGPPSLAQAGEMPEFTGGGSIIRPSNYSEFYNFYISGGTYGVYSGSSPNYTKIYNCYIDTSLAVYYESDYYATTSEYNIIENCTVIVGTR